MKVYFAGVFSGGSYDQYILNKAFKWRKLWKKHYKDVSILESYHYIQNKERVTQALDKKRKKIFLDSGAYSLFTQGVAVNLEAYAEFIHRNKKYIEVASNLDHIGGDAAKQTWKNQKELEAMGVKVIPVHHARDSDKWLYKYLEAGYKHLALGGMVPESTGYLEQWLDRIWGDILTDKEGKPVAKVHGFGLTTQSLMIKYPWYSVDSTTWMMNAAFGGIWIPIDTAIYKVLMYSSLSPAKKTRGAHYDTLSDVERKVIDKIIKEKKFKKEELRNARDARALFNLRIMRSAEKNFPWPTTFHNSNKGLF